MSVRTTLKVVILALAVVGAQVVGRSLVDLSYDMAKLRRAYYNEPRASVIVAEIAQLRADLAKNATISPEALQVIEAMTNEWLQKKQAEQAATPARPAKPK